MSPTTRTRFSILLAVALLLAAAPAAAEGQQTRTLAGRVTAEGGAPIAGATVALGSLGLTTTTDDAGRFLLPIPAGRTVGADTLHVTRIGYRPLDVSFTMSGDQTVVNAVMSRQVVTLDEVIVTGTAGNLERRAQAAVVSTVDASDIMTKAPVQNVNEMLYAQVPGLTFTSASGTSGANTRIDIRGQASISLSNYPLVFIDGVRVSAGPRGVAVAPGGPTAGSGGQQLNALDDINPDDIESIEVVKGPAAATLYGADASAGVIQILTKRGRRGGRVNQKLSFEYHHITPNFTPETNFAACPAGLVAPDSPNPLCRGQEAGTIVSDNVLERNDAFGNGWSGTVRYTIDGGGDNYSYFGSVSGLQEEGTTAGSEIDHRTGRVSFSWLPSEKVSIDANFGLVRADDQLPQGDQSAYGYLINGGFGSALSVSEDPDDGGITGGWFNNNLNVEAISAIVTRDVSTRTTPSVQMRYSPTSWFTNRVTVGADFVRTTATQMFPKNDEGWYSATLNTGSVAVTEANSTIYTIDYLGNINYRFGAEDMMSADLSFGSQYINAINEVVGATGLGLLTNSNNVISAATTTTASEGFGEAKSHGIFAQLQLGVNDRLFVQLGARVDRNSAFGEDVGSFFLPKAGVSYVLSDEAFWEGLAPAISTFRVRAAYGTTGRSPSATAALQTYSRSNYIDNSGAVRPGVSPGSPGNPELKPEKGIEIEAGFDAGFFNDRAGIEFTYFSKSSKDLLLQLPLAPSSGFNSSPFVNIGEVSNKGMEIAFNVRPIESRSFSWDMGLNLATLSNEIVSMGDLTPFISNNQCFKPGVQVAAWCVPQVLEVDTEAGQAIVSDTAQVAGGQIPKLTASLNTTVTLFGNLRVYGQLDGKFDYHIYDLSRDFRDRAFGNSADVVLPEEEGGYSETERLRRLGPFIGEESGAPVGASLVRGPYIVDGDFVRFRELSVTWWLPAVIADALRVPGSSISVGGRNLALWTDYNGDPEVIGVVDPITPFRANVFTTPQSRSFFTRLNLVF
jgi:TonB-linked SusC/RagA family outer membrane protein